MRDILFMGQILASVTHEMQNVMAIIKESGALTDDILRLNGPPRLKHGDKLVTALHNIQEQVGRGRNLMLMLNGFAHAAADYPERCDLPRFATQIGVLAERAARLKECSLKLELDERPLPTSPLLIRGNALHLMQGVYMALLEVLAVCAAGDTVHVHLQTTAQTETSASQVTLCIQAEQSQQLPDNMALVTLMTQMTGSCQTVTGGLLLHYRLAPETASHSEATP